MTTDTTHRRLTRRTRAERALERLMDTDSHDYSEATTKRVAGILHRVLRNSPTRGSRAAALAFDMADSHYVDWRRRVRASAQAERLCARDARLTLERYHSRVMSVTVGRGWAVAVMDDGRHGPAIYVGRPTDYEHEDGLGFTWTHQGVQHSECRGDRFTRAAEGLANGIPAWRLGSL
jgi:hypothetical protein